MPLIPTWYSTKNKTPWLDFGSFGKDYIIFHAYDAKKEGLYCKKKTITTDADFQSIAVTRNKK